MAQQMGLFSTAPAQPPSLALPDAQVRYYPNFLPQVLADSLFSDMQQQLDWQAGYIQIFGKRQLVPRLQVWYDTPDAAYRYSGVGLTPRPLPPLLDNLRQRCEQQCHTPFNSVLANLYRDGQDSMGWHADNEPELGAQPVIASLTFGEERVFKLRHQHSKQRVDLPLAHGSLLVMAGDTQRYWQHSISKSRQPMAARINLTFRRIFQL